MPPSPHQDRLRGALLGVALGDALGLPYEGLSAKRVKRRRPRADRFQLFGATGFVSDDTEQSALLAHALAEGDDDADVVSRFRRSMVGWFLRLPFGIGWGTLRACVRMAIGWPRPGVGSAGNGAAMRAGCSERTWTIGGGGVIWAVASPH
ncbi:MAG: ADP-ribosylglycohydrolase family protein [Sandaracinaceae bacterium]